MREISFCAIPPKDYSAKIPLKIVSKANSSGRLRPRHHARRHPRPEAEPGPLRSGHHLYRPLQGFRTNISPPNPPAKSPQKAAHASSVASPRPPPPCPRPDPPSPVDPIRSLILGPSLS